jgi:endonuclease-8
VAAALVNRPVTAVSFAFDRLKPFEPQLTGAIVSRIDTVGKAMLTRFSNGLTIYSHNQLYGLWMVRPAHDLPETKRQLRLAIHNQQHSALLYSASEIEVLAEHQLATHPFLTRVGPDPLHDEVTATLVAERLRDKRFARRRLGGLLLEQQFLAGIGNYLRSEALFVAGLHPALRPQDCSPAELERLARALVDLTRRSYATGGITNEPVLADALRTQGIPRQEYRFQVFNRENRACFRCGAPIEKLTVAGRRLYRCPACQPMS